jgi:hypothetical protein
MDDKLQPLPAEDQYHVPTHDPAAHTEAQPAEKASLASSESPAAAAPSSPTPAAKNRAASDDVPTTAAAPNFTPAATLEAPHVDLSASRSAPTRAEDQPVYKRSWFWVAVGAVAAGGVAAVFLSTRGGSQSPACPECTLPMTGVPTQ